MSTVTTPIADGAKESVDNKPMSEGDFLSRRIAKLSGTPPPKAAEPAPQEVESEPKAAVSETDSSSTEGSPQPAEQAKADVLSKDIAELTDEEIAELAQKGKSGLLKRIAELTAKRKMAEEEAARLKQAIAQQQQQLPEPKVENNPYGNIEKLEDLQAKNEEVSGLIEFLEDAMFKSEDLSADDPAAQIDGRQLTKAEVRDALRNARRARDKFIPAQFKELQARAERSSLEQAFKAQAAKELSWLTGEDNDTRKNFEAMVKDPRLQKLKERVPELAPQVDYLIAHAANSMYGRRSVEGGIAGSPSKPAINPPATPKPVAAAPERADARVERAMQDVKSRFTQTGSTSDWIALRSAQLAKRK